MAVVKVPQSTKLVIKVQTGVNESGKPVYRSRSYSNVKTSAADADVYAVGQALSQVQKYSVAEITRQDQGTFQEQ
jgi:hypothetical protein